MLFDELYVLSNSLATFLFDTKGTKRKVIKREMPRSVSPLARGERGVAPSPHKLLKKFDQNFYPSR